MIPMRCCLDWIISAESHHPDELPGCSMRSGVVEAAVEWIAIIMRRSKGERTSKDL